MNPAPRCSSCGVQIEASDEFCRKCGARVQLANNEQEAGTLPPPPKGISLRYENDVLTLRWRWFQAGYVAAAVMFIAAILWFAWFTWDDFQDPSHEGAIAMALGLVFWPFCLACLYWMAAGIFDTTTIEARRGRVSVSHGPLWWPGRRELPVDGLAKISIGRKHIQGARATGSTNYGVELDFADGRRRNLLYGVRTIELADFMVLCLGKFYRVKTFISEDMERAGKE